MIFIEGDELLTYWDELWEDHCVTQSELHHIIKDEWSDIHRYTLEELSEKNWHYPSKGEYPQNNKWVFVYLNDDTATVGLYCSWAKLKWIDNYENEIYDGDIVAWQYIVPPKEEA